MGRASTRQNKTPYQLAREELGLSRERAAELLRETELSIAAVAEAVGYDSAGKFSSAFRERYHLLPSEYRKAQK